MLVAVATFCQLVTAPAAPPTPWRIDADVAQSSLSGDLPDWSEVSLQAARALSQEQTVSVRLVHIERFDVREGYGEIRFDQALDDASLLYLAIGGGPDTISRPSAALRIGGAFAVRDSPILLADLALMEYTTGPSQLLKLGIEDAWLDQRLILNLHWIGSRDRNDDLHSGYALGVRWLALDRITLRASFAEAPEFDGQAMADVQATTIGVSVEINAATQLRATLLQEEREAYSRTEIGFGFARRL